MPEINNDKENAIRILEYWFTMEFLNQQKLNDIKNKGKAADKYIKEYKSGRSQEKKKYLENFVELESGDNLQKMVDITKEETQLPLCSGFTVFIGCMKKEICINRIAQNVKWKGQRPEENDDEIALASISFSKNGDYITNSLSISPLAWAVKRLSGGTDNAYLKLSHQNYHDEAISIEEKIKGLLGLVEDDSSASESNVSFSVFNAFLYNQLKLIEKIILEELELEYSDIESFFGVYYKLFNSEDEEKEYDAGVGLRMDFYSEDLESAVNRLKSSNFSKEKEKLLLDYILGLNRYYGNPKGLSNRFDVVRPKNEESLYQFMSETLTAAKAPLGKWPSRFMPALMQQIAVNLAIDEDVDLPIFSVNGPPGTGKTTLLKEIIVNNIIKKTKLLADYVDPDDAFFDYSFKYGKGPDNSYNQFVRKYHRLKNIRINSYSILVASSNNTAVENITKELPIEENILCNISPSEDMVGLNDKALADLTKLFTVSESSEKLPIVRTEKEKYTDDNGELRARTRYFIVDEPDIYFSQFATDLLKDEFDNKECKQAFGLISASLGKKSNITKVDTKVIKPLLGIMKKNEDVVRRKEKYLVARNRFLTQLVLVEKLCKEQDKLLELEKEIANIRIRTKQNNKKIESQRANLLLQLSQLDDIAKNLKDNIGRLNAEKDKLDENLTSIHTVCAELESKKRSLQNDIEGINTRIVTLKKSVSIWEKVIKTSRYKEVVENEARSYEKQEQYLLQIDELNLALKEEKKQAASVQDELDKISAKVNNSSRNLNDLLIKRNKIEAEVQRIEDNRTAINNELEKQERLFEKSKDNYQKLDPYERGFVLDRQFICDVLSPDIDVSTKAHLKNPWFSEHYNREREKLFLYALLMTKEFILGSKKCRDNFKHLDCLWSGSYNGDEEQIKFVSEDLEKCTAAAFETLFLLVPVVSSTFASVQRLFKNVKEENIIGTLIVDEAGQASPHMAIGALSRAKKAVIVGDPKQVEPVVTDDQDLLKQTYTEGLFKLYTDKTNSVQRFADVINPYGTYLKNDLGDDEWVGCPLLVHRRCINPMYEISNDISYNNIMKLQTKEPSHQKRSAFIDKQSKWINVSGTETGNKRHYVNKQGDIVINMLEFSFSKEETPNIFIISPFKTVEYGIKSHVKKYVKNCIDKGIESSLVKREKTLYKWLEKNVGTVHRFQGREADEVIFLLGCDTSENSVSAIQWVNNNIVNVAATRAKYRFYVIGDIEAWKQSKCVNRTKEILDKYYDDSHTLVVTEKSSVARAYAKVLGAYIEKEGYLEGNGYLISWCNGQLFELDKPDAYNEKYKKWDIKDLPIIPKTWKYSIKTEDGCEQQFEVLKQLMNRNDVTDILCATDAGRVGELIFRLVYHEAKCEKPFRRIWLSSMEKSTVREAFDNPKPATDFDGVYEAAKCRSLADWIVGINATRYLTKLHGAQDETFSVGRVMTPTMAMVVDREKEIKSFVPETYHTVNLNVGGVIFESRRFENEEDAIGIVQKGNKQR